MNESEKLTCFRLKMASADVEGLRTLARLESLRLGRDVTWCDLVRAAVRWMGENRRPVG